MVDRWVKVPHQRVLAYRVIGDCIIKPGGIKWKGATTAMSDYLWRPVPKAERTWIGPKPPREPRGVPPAPPPVLPAPLNVTGAERGTLIHQQMLDYITCSTTEFNTKHPAGPHPWMTRLHDLIVTDQGWRPIRGEYHVHCPASGLTADLDGVAVRHDGRLVFLEYKTGYAHGVFQHRLIGKWRKDSPMRKLPYPCTQLTLAKIQVLLGAILAMRQLGLPTVDDFDAVVVLVNGKENLVFPLSKAFVTSMGQLLYCYLLKMHIRTLTKKKKV